MSLPANLARRRWLQQASAVSGALALAGCAVPGWRGADDYRRPLSKQPFARAAISMEQVTRTRAGLRPFRAAGFVVRGERMGDKLLIHNYGHGGGGITMSWGSAMLAARELPDLVEQRAAVIGCGVIGLTTARVLQQRGWQVTIYAKDLPPNTTSDVAGGLWAPTSVFQRSEIAPAFEAQFVEALKHSHATFAGLAGRNYGVSWKENYHLNDKPRTAEDVFYLNRWPELFPGIAVLAPDEHPFAAPHVLRHLSLLIEPAIFLPRLMEEVREAGGRITVRAFHDAGQLQTLDERVLVNCTGLGAANLFGDDQLIPVRGQLAFVAPDERVDYVTHGSGEGLLYMFPRADGILLGGSYERGETRLEADPLTTERIVREHARMATAMRL